MAVIKQIFTDAANAPLPYTWVRVSLVSRAGWSKDGTRKAVRVHSDLTDATGLWTSPDLPAQSSYEESGTFYRVECAGVVEHFDVPATGGPFWLSERRRNPVPIDSDWKVLAKLVEAPDATALATMADGQVVGWNTTTKRFEPVSRVTSQQLADAVGPLALKTAVDNADIGLSNRIAPLENWKPSVDATLGQKANVTTVQGLGDRIGIAESRLDNHQGRIAAIEGGGSAGGGAVIHGSLRNLATDANGNPIDDHPQYFNRTRGDERYYTKSNADQRYAGLKHAGRHKAGSDDELKPADIGAASTAHALADHPLTGQVRPFVATATADATTDKLAHAGLASDLPTLAAPRQRSLRQPIIHAINDDIVDIVVGATSLNLLYTYDFVAREACELELKLTLYAYFGSPNPPVGATGQGIMSFYIYDLDNNSARVFDGFRSHWISAVVGYNGFRTNTQNNIDFVLPGVTCRAGGRYRFEMRGEKDSVAWGDVVLQIVRGTITEVAAC